MCLICASGFSTGDADDKVPGGTAESAGDAIRVPVTRDVWVSAYPTEVEGNNGGSPRLKLKGIQEFFLIDFDPDAIKTGGKRVVKARLHLHAESPEGIGRVTVSSVADAWVEGSATSYEAAKGASSFSWAENEIRRWRGDSADLTSVVLGNGGSQWGFADAIRKESPVDATGQSASRDWFEIPIDPAIVQARIDGRSHGFFVMDDVGSEYSRSGNTIDYRLFPNRYFSSRESNKTFAPYFTIWLASADNNNHAESNTVSNSAESVKVSRRGSDSVSPTRLLPTATSLQTEVVRENDILDLYDQPIHNNRLFAAKGEAVCIQIPKAPMEVESPAGIVATIFSMPIVAGERDPLVPRGHGSEAMLVNELDSRAFIEFYVEPRALAGEHRVTIKTQDQTIDLTIEVWNFTLPEQLSFLPQMNCYSLPEDELAYYRMAHEHRTVLNQLRYGWSGKVQQGAAPTVTSQGVWDWSAFDKRFAPLFDGSAFAGLRRDGVPIEAYYLPLNENWPMAHEQAFLGGYWIESAYPESYWQEFRNAARQFAGHIAEHHWHDTTFEFYLNNKVYFKRDRQNRWDACSAPWIFDEPVNTQDFWALRRFGVEFWKGVDEAMNIDQTHFAFRADISQPQWQRNLLDNVTNVEIVSGSLRNYQRRVMDRAAEFDNLVYMYGTANEIGTSNAIPAMWSLETWALGADGVVPWQTIGTKESWKNTDTLALFYPTDFGPVPSIRLKSFRAGQQLVEYLTMYIEISGVDRSDIGHELLVDDGLLGKMAMKNEADAGSSEFDNAKISRLEQIRRGLGEWLHQKSPAYVARWHDPRPPRRHPEEIEVIQTVH